MCALEMGTKSKIIFGGSGIGQVPCLMGVCRLWESESKILSLMLAPQKVISRVGQMEFVGLVSVVGWAVLWLGGLVWAQNVGIGTPNPTEKLHVAGNLRFDGALMPGGNAGQPGYILFSQGPNQIPKWYRGDSLYWTLYGNTIQPGNFIGTLNNQPFTVKVWGMTAWQIIPTPSVNPWRVNIVGQGGVITLDANANWNFIGIGGGNRIDTSDASVIVGGWNNRITSGNSSVFIGGGTGNIVKRSRYSVICGGGGNRIDSSLGSGNGYNFIGGGLSNHIRLLGNYNHYNVIVGGRDNVAGGLGAVVVGGSNNTALGGGAAVLNGHANTAYANSVVLTGNSNTANCCGSVILAGAKNFAADGTLIGNGDEDTITSGVYSVILTGRKNTIKNANGAFIFGDSTFLQNAHGTVVWNPRNVVEPDTVINASYHFLIGMDTPWMRVGINAANHLPLVLGLTLPNDTPKGVAVARAWLTYSDARLKRGVRRLGADSAYALLRAIQPYMYSWETDRGSAIPAIGFLAQEVRSVLPHAVYDAGSAWGLDYTALIPVLWRVVQDLADRVRQLEQRVAQLENHQNKNIASTVAPVLKNPEQ